jgi:hypothetical protein
MTHAGKSVWLNINGSGITAQLDTMMNPIQRGQLFFKLLMRKLNSQCGTSSKGLRADF